MKDNQLIPIPNHEKETLSPNSGLSPRNQSVGSRPASPMSADDGKSERQTMKTPTFPKVNIYDTDCGELKQLP